MFRSAGVPQNRQCAASAFGCSTELRLVSAAVRSSASVGLGEVGRDRIPGRPTPETDERRGDVGRELEAEAGRGDSARGGRFCICRSPAASVPSDRACVTCFNCRATGIVSFAPGGRALFYGERPRTCASRSVTRMPIERLSIA